LDHNSSHIGFLKETEVKNLIDKLTNTKPSQIDGLIGYLRTLEKNVESDVNFAFEFYGNKGKTKLIEFIKEWKDSNDPRQW
jgi:hypothetical protein